MGSFYVLSGTHHTFESVSASSIPTYYGIVCESVNLLSGTDHLLGSVSAGSNKPNSRFFRESSLPSQWRISKIQFLHAMVLVQGALGICVGSAQEL